jgi:undecaprenyl-diphosphatase
MDYFSLIIIVIAQYLTIVPVFIYGVYFIRTKEKKKLILCTMIIALLSIILALLAGALYYNPRPFVVDNTAPLFPHSADNGFPSDHVLFAAIIAASLLPFSKKYGLIVGFIALLIGIARVYAGVHHIIDIIASMLVAMISYGIFLLIIKQRQKPGSGV